MASEWVLGNRHAAPPSPMHPYTPDVAEPVGAAYAAPVIGSPNGDGARPLPRSPRKGIDTSLRSADSGVRLAELMVALSMATDLGMGQPLETALCSCVVAIRLGEALGFDSATLRDAYYYALLRYIGCNAHTDAMAALLGVHRRHAEIRAILSNSAVDRLGRSAMRHPERQAGAILLRA